MLLKKTTVIHVVDVGVVYSVTTPSTHHQHATIKPTTSPHQASLHTDQTNLTPKILIITHFSLYFNDYPFSLYFILRA
jgi:hypothetical protein